MRRCGSKTYIKITPAVLQKGLQIRQGFYGSMLVAVAAVLRHEPIFTKPLGFVDGSASAVEQLAMQRTIGIPNPWHSVLIPKFCAAFFTRHQKELFHFCIRPFRFHVSGTQRTYSIMNLGIMPLTLAPKSAPDFRRECALTHDRSVPQERAACIGHDAEHKGFGHSPTSILNLIFKNQIQKSCRGTTAHCLLQWCWF